MTPSPVHCCLLSSLQVTTYRVHNAYSAIGFGAMGIGGVAYGANAGSDEERFAVRSRPWHNHKTREQNFSHRLGFGPPVRAWMHQLGYGFCIRTSATPLHSEKGYRVIICRVTVKNSSASGSNARATEIRSFSLPSLGPHLRILSVATPNSSSRKSQLV